MSTHPKFPKSKVRRVLNQSDFSGRYHAYSRDHISNPEASIIGTYLLESPLCQESTAAAGNSGEVGGVDDETLYMLRGELPCGRNVSNSKYSNVVNLAHLFRTRKMRILPSRSIGMMHEKELSID